MAYTPPAITLTGLTIPSYADILDYYLTSFKNLYGQNVYLGNDSADYQLISILALAGEDVMQLGQMEYSNRSPVFATGAALDALGSNIGITRKSATFSTVPVVLSGTPNTAIANGVVSDVNGNTWNLPATVTIGSGGDVSVVATSSVIGAIDAQPSQITGIVTPTSGWTGVTNTLAATIGIPVESDSAFRARYMLSTELPSRTTLDGTIAEIAATAGVTRYHVVENATGSVDTNGNPAHSVTAVVEGGTDADVAMAIYLNRGIGPSTNGTVTVAVADPNNGSVTNISFDRPSYITVYVTITVKALDGYSSSTTGLIQQSITAYLNSLQIGESLTVSGIYGAALLVIPNISLPLFSIRAVYIGTTVNPTGTADIPITFNQVTQGLLANVVVMQGDPYGGGMLNPRTITPAADGSRTTFTVDPLPTGVTPFLWINGLLVTYGPTPPGISGNIGYTISGTTLTFAVAPNASDDKHLFY